MSGFLLWTLFPIALLSTANMTNIIKQEEIFYNAKVIRFTIEPSRDNWVISQVFVPLNVQLSWLPLTQHCCLTTERMDWAAFCSYLRQTHLRKSWTGWTGRHHGSNYYFSDVRDRSVPVIVLNYIWRKSFNRCSHTWNSSGVLERLEWLTERNF